MISSQANPSTTFMPAPLPSVQNRTRTNLIPLLLITFLFIRSTLAMGQVNPNKGNYRITGSVADSLTHQPVEFANVAVLDPATGKPVNGAVADEKGRFSITKMGAGRYDVVISFIGYESKKIPVVVGSRKDLEMGTLSLSVSVKLLEEIVVKGEKNLVEEKVDRTIYNAEQDVTTKGGDATDVLKRVPMLSVDMDGNVSLKGSSSVRVLINNKPSTITATSVADALKQIPADMIKSVEVITSPSAAYDAEGSAGIINIVLKKNTLEGMFVNADGSAGTRGSNAGANVSYRRGKMGVSMGAFQRWQYNVISDFHNEQTTRSDKDTLLNVQTNHNRSDGLNNQFTLNWDYDINAKNSVNVSTRYGQRSMNAYQDDLLTNTYRHDSLINSTLRNVKTIITGANLDGSIGYTRDFEKKRRQLNMLAIFSRNDQNLEYTSSTEQATNPADLYRYRNVNNGFNQETSVQIDYQEPISENQMLEFGGKGTWRNVSSDYTYYKGQGDSGPFVPSTAPGLNNNFNYQQDITAAYLSYSIDSKSGWSAKAGGRYEYTSINAHFEGQPDLSIPSYGVMVPSVNLTRKLTKGRQLRIAYNRRIVRPWLQALNPNLQASNPLNATLGNPNLKPEFADNYEIAYKTNLPKGTLNLSLWSRYNTNDIQPARVVKNDTIISVYQNLGSEGNYGFTAFASINFTERFTLNGGIDWIYRILRNNSNVAILNTTNSGFTQNYRLSGNYNFNKGWSAQLFVVFQGSSFNLQGYRTGVNTQSFGVRKEIWNKAGSLGMGVDNFATPNFNVYSVLDSPYVSQRTTSTLHNFIFKVNFSYRIGKKLQEKERKLKAEETDN
ncbi:MAG: TonB-dependent receptor [Bacteroidetes bacterium]|nr:TonB-dependent receptor [Bacteroidota bacterium]